MLIHGIYDGLSDTLGGHFTASLPGIRISN
jgi:hypothetical protein